MTDVDVIPRNRFGRNTKTHATHTLARYNLTVEGAFELKDEELLAMVGFGRTCLAWLREEQAIKSFLSDTQFETFDKPVKLHRPVFQIIRKLGLTPELVKRLEITPRTLTVTLYRLNEDGSKYVNPRTGRAATEERSYYIDTTNVRRVKA